MSSVVIKSLDIDTNKELASSQTYSNLIVEDYTYILKNIVYTTEGDSSNPLTFEVTSNSSITFNYQLLSEYIVDLVKFGIKNDGTAPVETATGINNALQYAKQQGYTKVIMPLGQYCISENISIIMVENITLDLNQSTFKINTNGLQHTTMVNFAGCKNAKLINGTLLGDRYQHDYTTAGSHEWNTLVTFNDCENCALDTVTVKSSTGYGISSSLGKNISNLVIGVTVSNLTIGGISDDGTLNGTTGTIRTINPINISGVGSEFELGYNKGYMGYPYMTSKIYDAYFYDKDMKFISSSKKCQQYKKVSIPTDAVFANFVFYQSFVPTKGDTDFASTTVFVTNYRSPYKISITNCLIDDNRCLGMGLCGGREFLIQKNTFSNNKGASPGYAIDMEDGWEYMDKYTFDSNEFANNANDVVICAGDEIVFENNHFTNTVYMWGRTTNYKFTNNKFEKISSNVNYEYSTDTVCTGNTYINCEIVTSKKNNNCKITIDNENLINTLINSMSAGDELTNSAITSDSTISIRLAGVYRGCTLNCSKGDYISPSLYGCTINSTSLNLQGSITFDGCKFINCFSGTAGNTKIVTMNNCKFTDSGFFVNTWARACAIDIENSQIIMSTGTTPFINISAGKMANLTFLNNTINNQIAEPVFNMYDTSYSTPNGNATIGNNSFTLTKYAYVFDGVNITSGSFTLTASNNSIAGAVLLNPKYINNPYFIIK